MKITEIALDMDGTLCDLYGVENWLDYLIEKNPYPYKVATPLVNFSLLARTIHRLQAYGIKVNVISWLAKDSNEEYDLKVTETKIKYLKKHLPSVEFDEIHIVEYGTPKTNFMTDERSILFDDEERNRNAWVENGGIAYDEKNLIEILKSLLD